MNLTELEKLLNIRLQGESDSIINTLYTLDKLAQTKVQNLYGLMVNGNLIFETGLARNLYNMWRYTHSDKEILEHIVMCYDNTEYRDIFGIDSIINILSDTDNFDESGKYTNDIFYWVNTDIFECIDGSVLSLHYSDSSGEGMYFDDMQLVDSSGSEYIENCEDFTKPLGYYIHECDLHDTDFRKLSLPLSKFLELQNNEVIDTQFDDDPFDEEYAENTQLLRVFYENKVVAALLVNDGDDPNIELQSDNYNLIEKAIHDFWNNIEHIDTDLTALVAFFLVNNIDMEKMAYGKD